MIHNATKALALSLLLIQFITTAQTSADKPSTAQEKPLKLRTEEVIVDAVVLDKKNRGVSDLTAADFEIYEDGVKQKISSFRFESTGAASQSSGGPTTDANSTGAPGVINLVSLVFDAQTTRDGALRARQAALEYIDSGIGPNDYVAVYGIDLGLMLLATFTNDKATIKQAVEAFTSRESKKYTAVAGEARRSLEGLVEPLSDAAKVALADSLTDMDTLNKPAISDDVRANPSAIDPRQLMLISIALSGLRTLRVFERYEREFQGWRSINALLAIINGQKRVRAGRKTMMYFSEGFAVTPAVQDQYKSVISAANTNGITIYALDIGGLRLVNPNEQAMLEREAAGVARIRNANPELVSGGASALGRNEEAARMNNLTTLDELSEETGGYTIKNTNDVSEGLRRILDELSNHYVITYLSTNQKYDGKFRRILVKLTRAGEFKVRARRGYYGLRTLDDSPAREHEVPLLERIDSSSPVSDFPFYAQALHFRGNESARQVAIYIEFPTSALSFSTDEKTKTFSSRFAILALIRNNAGEIVRKMGQEFILRGPTAQLDDVRAKPQLYNRLALLMPGHYTLEAAARDTTSGKVSVAAVSFEVPDGGQDSLRVSSVVLSRGLNPLTEDQKKQQHPLYLEGQAYFVPNVPQTFSRSQDKKLLMHFNAYTGKSASAAPLATVTFFRGGSVFSEASGPLPAPDSTGRIAYITSFGTENFPPGDYGLRVTVSDGSSKAVSTGQFKIEP